jgi:hypothetical protein
MANPIDRCSIPQLLLSLEKQLDKHIEERRYAFIMIELRWNESGLMIEGASNCEYSRVTVEEVPQLKSNPRTERHPVYHFL